MKAYVLGCFNTYVLRKPLFPVNFYTPRYRVVPME